MTKVEAESDDKFENGYFWELYRDLERQFRSFLEFVPYMEGNQSVYSFKLLNMILSIGGHIDSAFKEMARYADFSQDHDCREILSLAERHMSKMDVSLKAFQKIYGISSKRVIFKSIPSEEIVQPFSPPLEVERIPQWWFFYNDLKHDVSFNIKEATLKNARDALAGAFLLHAVHIPSIKRLCDSQLVKSTISAYPIVCETLIEQLKKRGIYWALIETPIFKYDYDQSGVKP